MSAPGQIETKFLPWAKIQEIAYRPARLLVTVRHDADFLEVIRAREQHLHRMSSPGPGVSSMGPWSNIPGFPNCLNYVL